MSKSISPDQPLQNVSLEPQSVSVTRGGAPELLLPVGTKEMALAAIHNGADAIFLGVPAFNARGRSQDFSVAELKEIIESCHLYDVKVNLAFNIVLFEEELSKVVDVLMEILPLGPDAFIVQDLGLARLIRTMAPHQRIHASTQMTVTNAEAIRLLDDLDIKRFVLGRENSLSEIQSIRQSTDKELEVFVHGALCVSYSGQCFTSESLGGRSANRGQCAQSCRFGYELHVDGSKLDLKGKKFLVSPQDLCGLEEIPQLMAMGVDSFKVEGRLKTPEYVATAAHSYRQMIDGVQKAQRPSPEQIENYRKEMATTYSRGFFSGWLNGVDHQKLVTADYSSHRGALVGKIIDTYQNTLTMEVTAPSVYQRLVAGDGLFWSKGRIEQGGFIYAIDRLPKNRLRVEFARDIQLVRDLEGYPVFQNHDKELKKRVAQSVEDKTLKKRLPLKVEVFAGLGEPLKAKLTQGSWTIEGQTSGVAVTAQSKGLSEESLKDEFNSLSGSIFRLESFILNRLDLVNSSKDAAALPPLFIPHKEIKKLRQDLVAQLTELKIASLQGAFSLQSLQEGHLEAIKLVQSPLPASPPVHPSMSPMLSPSLSPSLSRPALHVVLRDKQQVCDLLSAIEAGQIEASSIQNVTLDFEFGRDYASSLEALRSIKINSDEGHGPFKVGIATTRILKPNEYRHLKHIVSLNPDHILVRNLGALSYLTTEATGDFKLMGDFSLNVTNHLTAEYLFNKGLSHLCLSYDLNHQQVNQILKHSNAGQLELTVYQYMPSFHMEHCVFAAFLSEGSSYRDCGKPCERHEVQLKDQFQNWHHIKADQECRNTMFTARAQSASRFLPTWLESGLGMIRYEALKERGDDLIIKLGAHIDFIEGRLPLEDMKAKLGAIESYGLTEGAIGREHEYESRKKEF